MNDQKVSGLKLKGMFHVEQYRLINGIKTKIGEFKAKNAIVDVGLDKILDVMFHDATKITPWYIGLIDNASYSALDHEDTMSSHAGWIELTAYDEATRNEWTEGAASGQSITNSVPVTFTISATKTVQGIFITSINTKSATTGTLWSTALFPTPVPVADDDELKVTYTIDAATA